MTEGLWEVVSAIEKGYIGAELKALEAFITEEGGHIRVPDELAEQTAQGTGVTIGITFTCGGQKGAELKVEGVTFRFSCEAEGEVRIEKVVVIEVRVETGDDITKIGRAVKDGVPGVATA